MAESAGASAGQPVALPARRRGGFWGAAFGGALAAGLGAGAVLFLLPDGLRRGSDAPQVASIEATLAAQKAEISGLGERVRVNEAALANTPALDPAALRSEVLAALPAPVDLAPVTAAVDDLGARLGDIEARLAVLEARPVGDGAATSDALSAELAALRNDLAAQKAAIAEARAAADAATQAVGAAKAAQEEAANQVAAADAATKAAKAAAAIADLRAAIDAGTAFGPALDAAAAAGLALPADLRGLSDGVPSLASLQDGFAEAARAALAAAPQAAPDAGWADRIGAFLRSQTHARSLTPQEGDSPDAILSRIAAAVADGDLPMALAKVKALPEPAQAAIAGWTEGARRREAVDRALKALSAEATKGTP